MKFWIGIQNNGFRFQRRGKMKELLSVAIDAAKEAGNILLEGFGKQIQTEKKADRSIVTEIDKKSEKIITGFLHSNFPSHKIIGEESGTSFSGDNDGYCWVIDPLDGTHNYIRGISLFGVSIGLLYGQEFAAGVIYLPCEDILYVSERGSGSFKNNTRIKVSSVNSLQECTLAYDSGFKANAQQKLKLLQKIAPGVFNVRILGASVRNLTYLAEGKVDMVIEFDDKLWDYSAGISLVLEAGGKVSGHDGSQFTQITTPMSQEINFCTHR